MQSYKKWFIGDLKIIREELSDNKTWAGEPVWKLTFNDNTSREYPEAVIQRIATRKKTDLAELQRKRTKKMIKLIFSVIAEKYNPRSDDIYPMVEKILEALAEDDMNITDDIRYTLETSQMVLQNVCSKTLGAIQKSVEEANKVYWGMESYERTMMDVDKVIKQSVKDK